MKVNLSLQLLFPFVGPRYVLHALTGLPVTTRFLEGFHSRTLLDRNTAGHTEQYRRSVFGLVPIYNRLPQRIVDLPDVSTFQKELQLTLRRRCEAGLDNWDRLYTHRHGL